MKQKKTNKKQKTKQSSINKENLKTDEEKKK